MSYAIPVTLNRTTRIFRVNANTPEQAALLAIEQARRHPWKNHQAKLAIER